MRDRLAELRQHKAQVLAVDPHEAWAARSLLKESGSEAGELHFPLLADPTCTVSAVYGAAFQMRIHTELSNRPTTFIIDRQGVVRYVRRGKTFADRPTPEEIIEQLRKL